MHDYALATIELATNELSNYGKLQVSFSSGEQPKKLKLDVLWNFVTHRFRVAEEALRLVESELHPAMLVRTDSDLAYDKLISQLLAEYNLRQIVPFTTHRLGLPSPLQVRPCELNSATPLMVGNVDLRERYKDKLLVLLHFFPSIRSLTALTLMLHEVGHVIWDPILRNSAGPGFVKIKLELVDLLTRAMGRPPGDMMQKEVGADLIGGLLGGATFAATLCSHLVSKATYWIIASQDYPPPPLRIQLARAGAACVSQQPGDDSFFTACEHLHKLYAKSPPSAVATIAGDDLARLTDIVGRIKELLHQFGISTDDQPPVIPAGASEVESIRVLLREAGHRREQCETLEGHDYIAWERRVMKSLGMHVNPSSRYVSMLTGK